MPRLTLKFYYMMVRRKGDVGAVNQLVYSPLPWFQSPAGAWELGHVWLHLKPFHYVLDPSKALCDLASVSVYPSRDCTQTHTHMRAYAFTPKHTSPNAHAPTHTFSPLSYSSLPLEPRTVADKANVNLWLKVGSVSLQNEGQKDSRRDSQMSNENLAEATK